MSIKVVLFDLDGTLLPLSQDVFVQSYFSKLAEKLAPLGYDKELLIKTIWSGTAAMVKNDGRRLNEELFWDHFCSVFGEGARRNLDVFDQFYKNEFESVRASCGYSPLAAEIVSKLKKSGRKIVLATNPIFPSVATEARMRWAGLNAFDFELFTTYENSHYCKPNPDYYREILLRLNANASECLMVGNDVDEDMVAQGLGMKVFLLTDCLINRTGADISMYPNGDFNKLIEFIEKLD